MNSFHHRCAPARPAGDRFALTRRDLLAATAAGLVAGAPAVARAAGPQDQLIWAIHVSLAPLWFDPADTQALITPFMVLYALHDAMVKPMPDNVNGPCLAQSWSMSEDGLSWDFVLRDGLKFHDGEPITAEDVKFSFERYRGANQGLIKQQVATIETPDARHVRFKLNKPWPDFLTFYSSASGAGWIVPKKYVEKVGDAGFQKHPIGAGPYKFVSFTPGIELVLEAFDGYWRKSPAVKRVVMKSIPDETTRLAGLKHGEFDIAYSIRGELAEELQRTPGLSLKSTVGQATNWIYFPEQWDPKSPWHDLRVRQAANLALDRDQMNQALFLGGCKINNSIIPESFEYYWQPPPAVYDPAKAKELLAAAGFPNGFDAGPFTVDSSYSNMGEAAVDLQLYHNPPLPSNKRLVDVGRTLHFDRSRANHRNQCSRPEGRTKCIRPQPASCCPRRSSARCRGRLGTRFSSAAAASSKRWSMRAGASSTRMRCRRICARRRWPGSTSAPTATPITTKKSAGGAGRVIR